jgi:hypothetical protein
MTDSQWHKFYEIPEFKIVPLDNSVMPGGSHTIIFEFKSQHGIIYFPFGYIHNYNRSKVYGHYQFNDVYIKCNHAEYNITYTKKSIMTKYYVTIEQTTMLDVNFIEKYNETSKIISSDPFPFPIYLRHYGINKYTGLNKIYEYSGSYKITFYCKDKQQYTPNILLVSSKLTSYCNISGLSLTIQNNNISFKRMCEIIDVSIQVINNSHINNIEQYSTQDDVKKYKRRKVNYNSRVDFRSKTKQLLTVLTRDPLLCPRIGDVTGRQHERVKDYRSESKKLINELLSCPILYDADDLNMAKWIVENQSYYDSCYDICDIPDADYIKSLSGDDSSIIYDKLPEQIKIEDDIKAQPDWIKVEDDIKIQPEQIEDDIKIQPERIEDDIKIQPEQIEDDINIQPEQI